MEDGNALRLIHLRGRKAHDRTTGRVSRRPATARGDDNPVGPQVVVESMRRHKPSDTSVKRFDLVLTQLSLLREASTQHLRIFVPDLIDDLAPPFPDAKTILKKACPSVMKRFPCRSQGKL